MIAQQNKALELSKPDSNAGGRALPLAVSRAIIIEAGFAAQRQRSMAKKGLESELQQHWSWP